MADGKSSSFRPDAAHTRNASTHAHPHIGHIDTRKWREAHALLSVYLGRRSNSFSPCPTPSRDLALRIINRPPRVLGNKPHLGQDANVPEVSCARESNHDSGRLQLSHATGCRPSERCEPWAGNALTQRWLLREPIHGNANHVSIAQCARAAGLVRLQRHGPHVRHGERVGETRRVRTVRQFSNTTTSPPRHNMDQDEEHRVVSPCGGMGDVEANGPWPMGESANTGRAALRHFHMLGTWQS